MIMETKTECMCDWFAKQFGYDPDSVGCSAPNCKNRVVDGDFKLDFRDYFKLRE